LFVLKLKKIKEENKFTPIKIYGQKDECLNLFMQKHLFFLTPPFKDFEN